MNYKELSLKVSEEFILVPFKYLCSYACGYKSMLFIDSNKLRGKLAYSNTEYANGRMVRKTYKDFTYNRSYDNSKYTEETIFDYTFKYDDIGRIESIYDGDELKYTITYSEINSNVHIVDYIKSIKHDEIVAHNLYIIHIDCGNNTFTYQKGGDNYYDMNNIENEYETVSLYNNHIPYGYNILYASNEDIQYFETEYNDMNRVEFVTFSCNSGGLNTHYYKYDDNDKLISINDDITRHPPFSINRNSDKSSFNIDFSGESEGKYSDIYIGSCSFIDNSNCERIENGGTVHYSNNEHEFDSLYEDLKKKIKGEKQND